MKVSHSWLQTYFKGPIPSAEVLADLFTFHSFEIEGVEGYKTEKGIDMVIDAKILPDRAHFALSHLGIAEEIKALTKTSILEEKSRDKRSSIDEEKVAIAPDVSVPTIVVTDENFCTRYVARIIENIEVKESPLWLKEKLEAVGGRSINTIVDATNFVMFDIGQPLHAFDADKVKGSIVIRRAEDGEKMTTLDNKELTLSINDYVVADEEGILALAGIKGGKKAEVTSTTKRIIIESAHFHPSIVRRTAVKVGIRNESSKRFENEITPNLASLGMHGVSRLIFELCSDVVFGAVTDVYPTKTEVYKLGVSISYINNLLGANISKESMKEILERFSIAVLETQNNDELLLTIPTHRLDLRIQADIAEEVGRMYGYANIKGILPPAVVGDVRILPSLYQTERLKNALIEQGFSEGYLYTLVAKGDVEIAYPLASDKAFVRNNLSDGLVKSLTMNVRNADLFGLDVIKQFEIGNVTKGEQEFTSLTIAVSRVKKVKGRTHEIELKEVLENLKTWCDLDMIALGGEIKNTQDYAIIEVVLNSWIASQKIESSSYLPLHFDESITGAKEKTYKPFSVFPFIVRDIALFVPQTVSVEQVEKVVTEKGTELLTATRLFDVFTKPMKDEHGYEHIKTSYAFRMIFQSFDRTLTDEEINPIMDSIYTSAKESGWEVR